MVQIHARQPKTESEAKDAADKLVRDLAQGSPTAALTAGQANDALAALETLAAFRQATGRKLSLLAAVSEFTEVAKRVSGHTLAEAVDGFLRSVVTVKRVTLGDAIEQFIAYRKTKTVACQNRCHRRATPAAVAAHSGPTRRTGPLGNGDRTRTLPPPWNDGGATSR